MLSKRLDYPITLIPFLCVVLLCVLFMAAPEASSHTLESIRFFLGDTFGSYYLIIGLGIFFCSLYMAFSRYGSIRLGNLDKPQYSNFKWGSMMFTAGLAADILFYSLCEWMLYASEPHIADMGGIQDWASVYPLFHWGPIPWSFYMTLAVAFGFMLHVRRRNKQKYSEACRPLLGKYTDRLPGKFIDLLALFALLAGTATTFALAISHVLHIPQSNFLSVAILVITCVTYTAAVYFGMNGIIRLAASCIYLFFALLLYVFVCGGEMVYTVETGLSALGNLTQNFLSMATWTDALRTSSFPQNWTIFYWAYWMVWCVAAPFFIGSISKGRTIRQTVLGGYLWGLAGTFTSFIVLGNYGLGLQMTGKLDVLAIYEATGDLYQSILAIMETLPFPALVLILLALTMITFYATSFDAIAVVASAYSYKNLESDEEPDRRLKLFWSLFIMLLPIALIFSENSMANLQTVSIIAAFPIGFVIVLIIASFFKDASAYLRETESRRPIK